MARRELERLGGIRIAQSVYAEWESGRRVPSEANLARLQAFYGTSPMAVGETSDVAAAITRQAAAIEDQAAALRAQAEAFTLLAASIDRAATSVTDRVSGFDDLLRGLLVALGGQASPTPVEARDERPAGR